MPVATWPNLSALIAPLLGTPYQTLDCWQLVQQLFQEGFGLDLLGEPAQLNTLMVEVWFQGDPRPLLSLVQPWDCLLYSNKGLVTEHIGVVVNDYQMVHARPQTGVVLEPLTRYRRQILQLVRLRTLV